MGAKGRPAWGGIRCALGTRFSGVTVVFLALGVALAVAAPGAQALEPAFGEVLKTISGEITSYGSIDGVIEHYGGTPPAAKQVEIDRVLGEISSLNEMYGGRTVTGSGTVAQDLNEMGMSSDTTMQGYLEYSSNATLVRKDAVSIDEGEAAATEGGATTTAVGGELGDFADLAGIDSAIETAGPLIAFDPLAALAVGVVVVGGEYLALYGEDGRAEKEVDSSPVEAERWLRVQPGEEIHKAFERAFGTGSYGPGADGPSANWWYEGTGIETAPAGRPLYVLIFRAPCAFGAACTTRWYEGATAYRIVSLEQLGGRCKHEEAEICAPEESKFVGKPTFGTSSGPGAYWHPDTEPTCKEAPFEDPELAGWPPHFLRHHVDYWQDKSWDHAQEGCGLHSPTELTEPPYPAQKWDYQRLQGIRIVATLADLDLGFPRPANPTELTPGSVTVTPTEGNTGVTKAITGQDKGNESYKGAEKFLDHHEHAHTEPKGTIPLVPGVATELAKVLVEKNTSLKELVAEEELTDEQVEDIAEECVQDLVADGDSEAEGVAACESEPIFLSGSDVPAATEHDLEAINPLEGGEPGWVHLNYESEAVKVGKGEKRNWYEGLGGCAGEVPVGDSCDEYPLFSTLQGGPPKVGYATPSLEYIDKEDNSKQGGRYGNFVTACKMAERVSTSYAFLAVPMPPSLGIPTMWKLCN